MIRIFEGFDGSTSPSKRLNLKLIKIFRRPSMDPETRRCLIMTLKSGRVRSEKEHSVGVARCPYCNTIIGTRERTIGEYVWVEGSEHYVEKHDLVTPDLMRLLKFVSPKQ